MPPNEQALDKAVRQKLATYGEPAQWQPPAELYSQIAAQLPAELPAEAARIRQRVRTLLLVSQVAIAFILGGLLILGGWGVFIDSTGPATLFGGVTSTLGYILLTLVLIAKPAVHLALGLGLPVLLTGVGAALLLFWLWRWLLFSIPTPQGGSV